MTRKTYLAIAMLVMVALLVSACTTPVSTSQEPIKIGAIFMLTGLGSVYGENSRMGADLAIKEINAQGGINGRMLEMVYEDNQGDNAAQAVTSLRKLHNDGINIVIGPNWAPSGNAVAPIACEEKTLMISPSLGVASFNEHCEYLFNIWPHDNVLSEALGTYLYENGYRRLAILGSQQTWELDQAQAVKRGFEQAGGTVVAYQLPGADEKDFRTDVLKIKEAAADAVYIQYSYEDLAAKQLREAGVDAPFFSVLIDMDRVESAQEALEGTLVVTSFTPTAAYSEKFQKEYGKTPDVSADASYDAVMLLAQALKETQSSDPTVLKAYLANVQTYSGASGTLTFDGKRGVTKPFRFITVKNSTLVDYEG